MAATTTSSSSETGSETGTSIYSRIHSGASIVNSWPINTPVYIYLGHGADICNESGESIELTVPDNCIYITITQYGLVAYHTQKKIDALLKDTDETHKLLRYIYYPRFTEELGKLLNIDPEYIHVKLPGTLYIASKFQPASYWNERNYFQVSHSGLIERNDFIQKGYPILKDFNISTFTLEEIGITPDTKIPASTFFNTFIQKIYETFHTASYRDFNIRKLIKEKCIQEKSFHPEAKKKLDFFRDKNEIVNYTTMLNFLNFYILSIPKQRIIDSYNGSVYPTQEEVIKFIERYPDTVPIALFLKFISSFIEEKIVSNTKLMDTFPGIHFNVVCRAVVDSCKPKVAVSRSKSAERNRIRRNITQKQSPSLSQILESMEYYNTKRYGRSFNLLFQRLKLAYIQDPSIAKDSTFLSKLAMLVEKKKLSEDEYSSIRSLLNIKNHSGGHIHKRKDKHKSRRRKQ